SVGRGFSSTVFTKINSFSYLNPSHAQNPQVGDIIHINITGEIGGGDVIITAIHQDPQNSYFRFTTITNPQDGAGTHPVYGSREFGFETGPDGSTTFYTRAVDQARDPLVFTGGTIAQIADWTSFIKGLQNRIVAEGGRVIQPIGLIPDLHHTAIVPAL